jgi:hypothetical protein
MSDYGAKRRILNVVEVNAVVNRLDSAMDQPQSLRPVKTAEMENVYDDIQRLSVEVLRKPGGG